MEWLLVVSGAFGAGIGVGGGTATATATAAKSMPTITAAVATVEVIDTQLLDNIASTTYVASGTVYKKRKILVPSRDM